MRDGQQLFEIFAWETQQEFGGGLPLWPEASCRSQAVWARVARNWRSRFLPDEDGKYFDPVNRVMVDWKFMLARFGRHHPSCQTGAICTCGFAEIEAQLTAKGR